MLRAHGCTVDSLDFKIDFGNLWAKSVSQPLIGNSLNATLPAGSNGMPVPSGRCSVNIIRHPLAMRNPSDHSSSDPLEKYSTVELEDSVFECVIKESVSGESKYILIFVFRKFKK